eukprot:12383153-Ditylum_brightwellii.AAC.1
MSPAPAPSIPDDEVGEIIRDVVEDQNIIGSDNFSRGGSVLNGSMHRRCIKKPYQRAIVLIKNCGHQ